MLWGCPSPHPQNAAEPGWSPGSCWFSPPETIGLRTEVSRSDCWACCAVASERSVERSESENRAFRGSSRQREAQKTPLRGGGRKGPQGIRRDRPRHCGSGGSASHQQSARIERARRQLAQVSTSEASPSRASCTTAQRPHLGAAHTRHHPPVRGCLQRSRAVGWSW